MTALGSERAADGSAAALERVDVLLVDDDESWARATGRLLETNREAFAVETAHSLGEGRDAFVAGDPDCVVCDYQLGDGTGLDLLATVRDQDSDRPFVLVTGRGSETVASDAIGRGVTDYIRKDLDGDDAELLASRVESAVRTYRTERALERQRRSKNAMLDILTATTAADRLKRQFCAQLVEDRGYACAWIGTEEGGTPEPAAAVGGQAYLAAVAARDGAAPEGEPAGQALARDEAILLGPIEDHGDGEPATEAWAALATEHGFAGAIAAPIAHEGVRFGVLAVYAAEPTLLTDRERRAIAEYAETIGYALRAHERTRSLLADEPVRIGVEIEDPAAPAVALARALPEATSIEIPSAVPQASRATLYVVRAEGVDRDTLAAAVDEVAGLAVLAVHDDADGHRCDVRVDAQTPERIAADHGARFEGTVVERGVATVSLRVPDDGTIQTVVDALETTFDAADVATVWTERAEATRPADGDVLAPLTDRQRDVLQHAFYVGYFERPRDTSATELAEQLDLARATTTQHLRAAQRKLLGEVLPEADLTADRP